MQLICLYWKLQLLLSFDFEGKIKPQSPALQETEADNIT